MMPNAGKRAGQAGERVHGRVRLRVVGLDLAVHQAFDLVRVEVARDHHAQVVGDELDHVVVAADDGVLLEQRRAGRVVDVLLDRHQAFLARLLQDVVEQRHQLHVARLRVLRALEDAGDRCDRRLQHLRLVVHRERAERAAQDRQQLGRQRVQDHADVAAVDDVGAEDAAHRDGVTDQNDHGGEIPYRPDADAPGRAGYRRALGPLEFAGTLPARSPQLARNHWRIKKRVPRDPHSKHSDVLEETSKNTNGEPCLSVPRVRT